MAALPQNKTPAGESAALKRRSRLLRFLREPKGIIGGLILALLVLVAICAPLLATHDPYAQDIAMALRTPSAQHWFGTDELGRDLYSRMVYGSRPSLAVGFLGVVLGFIVGVPLGTVSGFVSGRTDRWLMGVVDVMMAFPGILLAIAIVTILGPGLLNVTIAVSIFSVPIFARTARGLTLSVKAELFVEAARALGSSHLRVLAVHILPNIMGVLAVLASVQFATTLLNASALSFLGLGPQPPSPDWGLMLSSGRNLILHKPHVTVFPGLGLALAAFGFNFAGEAARAAFDPRGKVRA